MKFDELYENNYQQVYKTVAKYVKQKEDAEDVTHDVFIKAYNAMDSFDGLADVSTWLTRIAINEALDFLRDSARSNNTFVSVNVEEEATYSNNPEQIQSGQEMLREVQRFLDELPPVRRRAFELRELEGKSYSCVAEEVSTPVNTVKTWVKRDRDRIKLLLSP